MQQPPAADSKKLALADASFFAQAWNVKNATLAEEFTKLSTPLVTDAAVRLKLPFRIAPGGIAPLIPGVRVAGRVLPAKHFGSVDVFLEAMETAEAGDALVIDNGGRRDEGCIGEAVRSGTTLRTQLRFSEFLEKRAKDPAYTLRRHLRATGGAIEE